MSSAFYPLGMKSYNNHLPQGGYKTWKGTGASSNPVAMTAGNIRPFTNKDYFNDFPSGFGLPRPIKHFRKGKIIAQLLNASQSQDSDYQDIVYNNSRSVKSSTGGTMVKQLIDTPGGFNVFQNPLGEINNIEEKTGLCNRFRGASLIVDYYPNETYLTDNPQQVSTVPTFCCNEERKAKRRVLSANTNLPKTYYTTLQQYRENRCQTYDQRIFNFQSNVPVDQAAEILNQSNLSSCQIDQAIKPGGPLSMSNTYLANCQPNLEIYSNPLSGPSNPMGCKLVVYKPNNPQFAQQGGVSSSTHILKKNVDTINVNLKSFTNGQNCNLNTPFILKSKSAPCNPALYTTNGNPRTCFRASND